MNAMSGEGWAASRLNPMAAFHPKSDIRFACRSEKAEGLLSGMFILRLKVRNEGAKPTWERTARTKFLSSHEWGGQETAVFRHS